MIAPFASRPSPQLVFGPGKLSELPAWVREVGGSAVFLVSDTGLLRAGHVDKAKAFLAAAGIPVTVYDHSHQNPSEADAAACCEAARKAKVEGRGVTRVEGRGARGEGRGNEARGTEASPPFLGPLDTRPPVPSPAPRPLPSFPSLDPRPFPSSLSSPSTLDPFPRPSPLSLDPRPSPSSLAFDCIVALGGGSSMDTAKACNFLLTNGGAMRDYHGYAKATKPMLPLIAIPTTAGTGSECQSYALVSRDDTHEKMACGDPKARPRIAILDPDLTETQPRAVAIQTGLDALAHALESAVSTGRNAVSAIYSEGAFRHLSRAIGSIIAGHASRDDRGNMQLGAALAGLAIENSMLGAAHATANPLTARHNVIHGHAVALMLPHVMRFNAANSDVRRTYARFSEILQESNTTSLPLIEWVADLVARSALPGLNGATPDFTTLARDAAKQWTGKFNPRPLQHDDFVALYRSALGGHAG